MKTTFNIFQRQNIRNVVDLPMHGSGGSTDQ